MSKKKVPPKWFFRKKAARGKLQFFGIKRIRWLEKILQRRSFYNRKWRLAVHFCEIFFSSYGKSYCIAGLIYDIRIVLFSNYFAVFFKAGKHYFQQRILGGVYD